MKVARLRALLRRYSPDAEVHIMSQPAYPFEYDIAGVTAREDFEPAVDEAPGAAGTRRATDVFIVEGTQLRYGARGAWKKAVD